MKVLFWRQFAIWRYCCTLSLLLFYWRRWSRFTVLIYTEWGGFIAIKLYKRDLLQQLGTVRFSCDLVNLEILENEIGKMMQVLFLENSTNGFLIICWQFIASVLLGVCSAARLENTYLPPNGANGAGGGPGLGVPKPGGGNGNGNFSFF